MINWLKKYWIEVLVIAILGGVYILCASPAFTWMNADSDGPEYVMDAIYLYPAHHTSAPLYLLTGHLFEMLPFGHIYWRMSIMSGLFTVGSLIFIYFIVRNLLADNKYKRFWALLAVTIFGGSALAISQAVIVETYAIVTFFSIGAYYFVVKKQWYWASAFIGMGVVTHHLIFLTWMALFVFHKELRPFVLKSEFPFIKITNIKPFLITCSFLIFYIYMPLSKMFTDQPNMWGNTTFKSFFTNNISVFTMLIGQIAIYDLPKRILDSLGVLGISLGLGLPIVLWWAFKIKTWKNELLWLFVLPIAWQVGDLAPQCFPKGTPILKRVKFNGGLISVPIEEIRVGDEVLSYNVKTGEKEYKKVTALFQKSTEELIVVKLSNNTEIKCTLNHPFAVKKNGKIEWVEAKELKSGDELISFNGSNGVYIQATEIINIHQNVYNFEVADNNNYFAYGILVHNCMKYMEASVAWGSIITVTFLAKYGWKWALPVWVSALTLLGINANYWDLGRTLDPNLSATQFYEKEIPKMKDGDIFITQGAWEWIEIFLYNKQNDRHIETICMGILASSDYQQMLLDKGVKLTDYDIGDSQASNELNKKQVYVALSIIEQNENVWTSRPTDPATYGSEVVPAKENTDQIKKWLGSANVTPVWHWKPDSPFSCISGDIEIEKWNFILQSNKTAMSLSVWVIVGAIFGRMLYKIIWSKKEKVVKNGK